VAWRGIEGEGHGVWGVGVVGGGCVLEEARLLL
jgi:hypothetical protein